MKLQELQHKILSTKEEHAYKFNGVPIFCTTGVHEKIFESFSNLKKDKNINILVLGSGAGAFERRLLDNGYKNIVSVEFVPETFIIGEIVPLCLDLNKNFDNLGKFDAIFAIELIEHLENQFHFIRCVKNLIKDDGVFYLSTPNIESNFARIKYFLTGRLHWFGFLELDGTGHISPIFLHILKFNLSQNNLIIKKHLSNDNIWNKLFKHKSIKIRIVYLFFYLFNFFMIGGNNFDINIFEIGHDK